MLLSLPPETLAVLVTLFVPGAVATPTLTLKAKVLLPAAAIAVLLVQVTVWPEAEQLQPVPVVEPVTKLRPVGSVSVTVMVPELATPPLLLTVKLYVPAPPTVKSPLCDLLSVRSVGATVTAESLAVLFPLFAAASPPPDTATLLTTGVPAPGATLTPKLNTLLPLAAMTVVLEQVMTCGDAAFEEHVQLAAFVPPGVTVPVAPPLTLKPAGRVSVKVIVPEVG